MQCPYPHPALPLKGGGVRSSPSACLVVVSALAAASLTACLAGCATVRTSSFDATNAGAVAVPADAWRTHAERTDYAETARYAETVEYCRRLAAGSPYARYLSFGRSGEGRDLPLLVLSREPSLSPETAHRTGRPLVLIQNCIHSGECAGKDACLELARDILITRARSALLDHVNLLLIPIFNVDGHERVSRYSRINQNGPQEMGWRTTATNLNLNRDYAKADAPEMIAWLNLWHTWQPDLYVDTHETDGEDNRYDLFFTGSDQLNSPPPLAEWVRGVLWPNLLAPLEADGYYSLPYGGLKNRKAPAEGFVVWPLSGPRFSHGYGTVCNRPSLLVEVHAPKPYARRVRSVYRTLEMVLRTVNRQPQSLIAAGREADRLAAANRGAASDGKIILRAEVAPESRLITYRAFAQALHDSPITGDQVIEYTRTPEDLSIPMYDQSRATLTVTPPAAYLIPPQWTEVIDRLAAHHIRFSRLPRAQRMLVDGQRFEAVSFEEGSHEGRQIPRYQVATTREDREFSAGTVLVPMDQPLATLAAWLLEPESPDSFAAWGFFNAAMEQKEYAEAYVMEPLARKMIADDPALRAEFEARLRDDPAFAGSPSRRLNFFYFRSPFADDQLNVYPVARLVERGPAGELAADAHDGR